MYRIRFFFLNYSLVKPDFLSKVSTPYGWQEESKAEGAAALPAAREAYRTHLQEQVWEQKLRPKKFLVIFV